MKRLLEQLQRIPGFQQEGFDVIHQLRPARETGVPGQHQLGVGKRDGSHREFRNGGLGEVRMVFLKRRSASAFPERWDLRRSLACFRSCSGSGRGKRFGHTTLMLKPVVRSQAALRLR